MILDKELKPINHNILKAFDRVYSLMKNEDIDWVLTGSLSFFLQGIDMAVKDIDIQSSRNGIYKIQDVLSPFVTRPVVYSESNGIRSYFGKAEMDNTTIELMGDIERSTDGITWTAPINIAQSRCWIVYRNMEIPVLDLKYEYQAYRELGRDAKADLIKMHMRRTT
jgi:hypothetical protein